MDLVNSMVDRLVGVVVHDRVVVGVVRWVEVVVKESEEFKWVEKVRLGEIWRSICGVLWRGVEWF